MRLDKNACLVCRCNGELPNPLFSCMKNVNFEFRSLLLIFDFLLFVFARAAGGAYFAPRAILVGGAAFLKGKTHKVHFCWGALETGVKACLRTTGRRPVCTSSRIGSRPRRGPRQPRGRCLGSIWVPVTKTMFLFSSLTFLPSADPRRIRVKAKTRYVFRDIVVALCSQLRPGQWI